MLTAHIQNTFRMMTELSIPFTLIATLLTVIVHCIIMLFLMTFQEVFLRVGIITDVTSICKLQMGLDMMMQILQPFVFLATGSCKTFMNPRS